MYIRTQKSRKLAPPIPKPKELAPPIPKPKELAPPIPKPTFDTPATTTNGDFWSAFQSGKTQALGSINAAYDSLVAQSLAQKGAINAQADKSTRQVYGSARVGALGNNEALAARGLAGGAYENARSGYSESSRVQGDVTMQNNFQSVRDVRDQNLAQVDRDVAALQARRAQEIAGLESDYSKLQLSALQEERKFAYQEKQDNQAQKNWLAQFERSKSQDQLERQKWDYSKSQDSQAQKNWLAQFNHNKSQDQFQREQWDYRKTQDKVDQKNWQAQFNYKKSQDQFEREQWDYRKTQDKVDQKNWLAQFNYKKSQDQLAQKNAQAKAAQARAQTALKNGQWWSKFNYDQAQDAQKNAQWWKNYNYKVEQAKVKEQTKPKSPVTGKASPSKTPSVAPSTSLQEFIAVGKSTGNGMGRSGYVQFFDDLIEQGRVNEKEYVYAMQQNGIDQVSAQRRLKGLRGY